MSVGNAADQESPQSSVGMNTLLDAPALPDYSPEIPYLLDTPPNEDVQAGFQQRMELVRARHRGLFERYTVVALCTGQEEEIEPRHAEKVSDVLNRLNSRRRHDILLVLRSRGGQSRAAYDISKLCQSLARERFVVAVPGQAQSAATLIALGADELHLGPLAKLGPIDPQLSDTPFPELDDVLNSIVALGQEYPGSAAEFLADYVPDAREFEWAGEIARMSALMVQDAEGLLRRKSQLGARAHEIAYKLVHDFEDHNSIIDREKAVQLLGTSWTKTRSNELIFSQEVHILFLVWEIEAERRNQRIELVGAVEDGITIVAKPDQ